LDDLAFNNWKKLLIEKNVDDMIVLKRSIIYKQEVEELLSQGRIESQCSM